MVMLPLPKELQEKARKEVNEVASRIPEHLNHLRDWLSKQPHLNARTDDLWLLNFLRGCKFNLERTKEKLDLYYTSKTSFPEFFDNRDPLLPEIQEILSLGIILPLATEDFNGVLIRWKDVDPTRVSLVNVVKVATMVFDISFYEDNIGMINGQHVTDDFSDFSLRYVLQASPMLLKKMVIGLQNAYPLRIKSLHCINVSPILKAIFDLVRILLSDKIKDRFHCYAECDLSKIQEFIPVQVIPKEYGGEGRSVQEIAEELKKKVESYRDWFLEDAQYCCDETKRPKVNTFGTEVYRKLDNF